MVRRRIASPATAMSSRCCGGLVEVACPRGAHLGARFRTVLNVTLGSPPSRVGYNFHYDAHVVTMAVPVLIPDAGSGRSGELVVFANRRPFRRSALVNVGEKLVMQNCFSNRRIMRPVRRGGTGMLRQLELGNAYLFCGHRTLHGNMPCAPGAVRATLLVHFGNPHGNHPTLAFTTQLRKMLVSDKELPPQFGRSGNG